MTSERVGATLERAAPAPEARALPTVGPQDVGLGLLAPSALVTLLISVLLLIRPPTEKNETIAWALAIAVGLPGGLWIGLRQSQALRSAAPAAAIRALAIGVAAIATALLLRDASSPDRLHHAILALAAGVALAAPAWSARRWRDPRDTDAGRAGAVVIVALAATVLPFAPEAALRGGTLAAACVLAALTLLGVRTIGARKLPPRSRRGLDLLAAAALVGVVALLPELQQVANQALLHHNFYLGPANSILHGHPMLNGTWSQYGIGSLEALALAFKIVPIGYGQLWLICTVAICVQYVVVLATLRLAGLGQLLAFAAVAVAVLGNVFALEGLAAAFPSVTPIRFGIPYLIVLAGVIAARTPGRERAGLWAQLGLIAFAGMWSFETWVYTGATFAFMTIVEALPAGRAAWRIVMVRGCQALAATVAGVGVFALATLIFTGGVDFGPYIDFVRLYTGGGLGTIQIDFFSPGPLMAAEIFLSAAALLWLALNRPTAIAAPTRVAIAGYTGFAIGSFTYYLGRSHPNNLLNLLVPAVVLLFLWVRALTVRDDRVWATAGAAVLLLFAGTIAAWSWPFVKYKWQTTAFAQTVPFADGASLGHGKSVRLSLERLWHNPVMDPRAPDGVRLIDRYIPRRDDALVITEPDLTTEILLRAKRDNVLPIANAIEDDLVPTLVDRARAVASRVPAGTYLLTSEPPADPEARTMFGNRRAFTDIQNAVLEILHRRFEFRRITRSPDGLEMVRLDPR
jgi:hypothetical protein